MAKKYLDWEPIKNPVLQNFIVGTVLGIVIAIDLRAIVLSNGKADWAWVMLVLVGPVIGLLSGFERKRLENRKKAVKK